MSATPVQRARAVVAMVVGLIGCFFALDWYLASRLDDLARSMESEVAAGRCTAAQPCDRSLEADMCNALMSGPLPLFKQSEAAVDRVQSVARPQGRCASRGRAIVRFVGK